MEITNNKQLIYETRERARQSRLTLIEIENLGKFIFFLWENFALRCLDIQSSQK